MANITLNYDNKTYKIVRNWAYNNGFFSQGTRSLDSIKYIVIHYTGDDGRAASVARYFKNNRSRYAGAHFTIDNTSGVIYQSGRFKDICHSVGGHYTSKNGAGRYYQKCKNSNSVSIELAGIASHKPSKKQIAATRALISYIQQKCPEAKRIIRHWDVNGKQCPGRFYGNDNTKRGKAWLTYKNKIIGKGSVDVTGDSITKFSDFLRIAEDHVGEDYKWTIKHTGLSAGDPWCAGFVVAVAKAAGVTKVIPSSGLSVSAVSSNVLKAGGKKISKSSKPKKGDLAVFKSGMSHISIVVSAKGKSFTTIGGNEVTYNNLTSKVAKQKKSTSAKGLSYFVRPKWSKVGGAIDNRGDDGGSSGGGSYTKLYNELNEPKDAEVREVGYIDGKYEPSIKSSTMKLSVINYTAMLEAFVELVSLEDDGSPTGEISTKKLKGNCKKVVDFLIDKGLTGAAACGIAGNIAFESGFKPETHVIDSNGKYSSGICQWNAGRGDAMMKYVGKNWRNDLTGQCKYLWHDLKDNYSGTLKKLKKVKESESGAKQAADIFVREFERPKYVDSQSVKRQSKAAEYWRKLKITKAKDPTGTPVSKKGKKLKAKKTVKVPKSLKQSGLTQDFTHFSTQSWGYNCRKVFNYWKKSGSKTKRHNAIIDGYYLVAVRPRFGKVGDVIKIVLRDGTGINCIIQDTKGDDAQAWGHPYSGGISIVEWELVNSKFGPGSGKYYIDLGKWQGKKVDKIINYGSYFKW